MDGTETQQLQQANGLFTFQSEEPNEQIMKILFEKDDISWQQIIYELVRNDQMDPWDIDISLLTKRYIEMLQKLKELNFRVSGKIVLAAAILLKIKSTTLIGKDMLELDRLIDQTEAMDPDLLAEDIPPEKIKDLLNGEKPVLIPRLPQPRKRKVSIYDLVKALEKALEVKERRLMNSMPKSIVVPKKPVDITIIIKELYIKIKKFFSTGYKLTFDSLLPSKSKEDIVYTFIPLLHLANQRKIDMQQEIPFGEIEIKLVQQVQTPKL